MAKTTNPPTTVEELPFLGKSWYKRGFSYWLRRSLFTLGTCAGLAVSATITVGLAQAIATDSTVPLWARVLILVAISAAIVYSMVRAWSSLHIMNRARRRGVAMSLAEASGRPPENPQKRRRRVVSGSAGLGSAAMLGGGALLVISMVFSIGWAIVFVVMSCQKYFSPEEFAAWQRIEHERRMSGRSFKQ